MFRYKNNCNLLNDLRNSYKILTLRITTQVLYNCFYSSTVFMQPKPALYALCHD